MTNKYILNGLAVIGAFIVLIGVLAAAGSALAADADDVVATAVAIHDAADTSIDVAVRAHVEAADHAFERIASDIRLDLDIRLLDQKSAVVAHLR